MKPPHKHAFVGTDKDGDSCIYVIYLDEDGGTGAYLPQSLLQKIADKINATRIGSGLKKRGESHEI